MDVIINKYLSGQSLDTIASDLKKSRVTVTRILRENSIKIKKRGNIRKYNNNHPIHHTEIDYLLKCKKTKKVFNDTFNKSGAITHHLKNVYPNLQLPSPYKRRMQYKTTGRYWFEEYFDRMEKIEKETIKCPYCKWETIDTTNKSGSLTKHCKKEHNKTISDIINENKDLSHLFVVFNSQQIRKENIILDHIVCLECGEKMKTLSNTHLKTHGLTHSQYKMKHPDGDIMSKELTQFFSDKMKKLNETLLPNYQSKGENEIKEFLETECEMKVIQSERKTLKGTEIDLFIPSQNIGIEYNGLYWHSEKMGKHKTYHLDKSKLAAKNGIKLIHIFSDEWEKKKDIIKHRLKNLLGQSGKRLMARKCVIREVSKKEKSDFLNKYHLQGNDKSQIYVGAYFGDDLVAVMTFGTYRISTGLKQEQGGYELQRFATKYTVSGVGSRLLKYFITNYSPKEIISYADRKWSPIAKDTFYQNIGFDLINEGKPNYWYTIDYRTKLSRFNFTKGSLVKKGADPSMTESQIMNNMGYGKIWDCGSLKFKLILNNI